MLHHLRSPFCNACTAKVVAANGQHMSGLPARVPQHARDRLKVCNALHVPATSQYNHRHSWGAWTGRLTLPGHGHSPQAATLWLCHPVPGCMPHGEYERHAAAQQRSAHTAKGNLTPHVRRQTSVMAMPHLSRQLSPSTCSARMPASALCSLRIAIAFVGNATTPIKRHAVATTHSHTPSPSN